MDARIMEAIHADELNCCDAAEPRPPLLIREACLSADLQTALRAEGYTSLYDYLRARHPTLSRYGIRLLATGDIVRGPYWSILQSDEEEIWFVAP